MSDELKPCANFGIGDEVYIHGYIDEIRSDTVIIRNDGGYFGTAPHEVIPNTCANDNLPAETDISADGHTRNDTMMDSRENLEVDIHEWIDIATYKAFTPERMLEVMHHWLDRQAAITEQSLRGKIRTIRKQNKKYRKQIAELTAERDQYKQNAKILADKAQQYRAERDHLRDVVKQQADNFKALEIRATRTANPVEIQAQLARFADEWTAADTHTQEQRLIAFYAQQIASIVDNPGGGE